MVKHGKEPYLECSSRGDKRFSAFYAKVGGRTIEERYQSAKLFKDGTTGLSVRAAKGRQAVNALEVRELYDALWEQYIKEDPELIEVLIAATGLSDIFGEVDHACQATTLWCLREAEIKRRAQRKDSTL